jgi:hypothetical protein
MRLLPLSAMLLLSLGGPARALAQEAAAGPAVPALLAPPAPPPAPTPTPGPTAAAAAPAAGTASTADIAELKQRIDDLEAQQAESAASAEEDDQRFKIYGFVDFGLKNRSRRRIHSSPR